METLPWPGRGAELLVGEAAVHPPRERGNSRTTNGTLLPDASQSCRGTISEAFSASFTSPRQGRRGEAFLPEAGPGLRKARRKRVPHRNVGASRDRDDRGMAVANRYSVHDSFTPYGTRTHAKRGAEFLETQRPSRTFWRAALVFSGQ